MSFRWGILGPGAIARRFGQGVQAAAGAEFAAVASRSMERSQAYADEFSVPRVYDNYDALFNDPEVDCIYVATPHPYHLEVAKQALAHKKPVLCEKPLCVNSKQVAELLQCAKDNDTFLMEAMWTRCMPVMRQVHEWVKDGKIGELRHIKASFGFKAGFNPEGRLFSPELAGGSLLDVGVYVVALTQRFFPGAPKTIQAMADLGKTGIDEQCVMHLQYDNGAIADIDSSIQHSLDTTARIYGTDGMIEIEGPFWCTTKATLRAGGDETVFEQAHKANGFEYEAEEVARAVQAGEKESPLVTHADSVQIMAIMDAVREQVGLKYPFE